MKKLPLIESMKLLREKVQLLDILKELDIASKLMQLSFDNVNTIFLFGLF